MTGARARLATVLAAAATAILATPAGAAAQSANAADPPAGISARSAIVVETTTGEVLYQRRASTPRAIASATKLMTALLTLERAQLSDVVTASRYRASAIESRIDLRPGERLTVADLLRALLLESANDAAMTLAEHVSGSRARFVRLMNARARQLGLAKTRYANPIGLDARGNRSTARDLVTLTLTLRTFPFFRKTVARSYVELDSGDRVRTVRNRNTLVRLKQVDGVKTGHTGQAGYVLVGSGKSRNVRLITVVLGTPSMAERNDDTLDLMRFGFARVSRHTLVKRGAVLATVPIRDRRGAELNLVASRTVRRVVRRGDRTQAQIAVRGVPADVAGPVARGQQLGTATVSLHGRRVAEVRLLAQAAVPEAGLAQRAKQRATEPWALILGTAALAASAMLVGTVLRRRQLRATGRARRARATEAA
jgi:D-alanyl-D-alanine carboxypeptidase (penicillin-binding protein 5/6)